jgi:hypothetical protein
MAGFAQLQEVIMVHHSKNLNQWLHGYDMHGITRGTRLTVAVQCHSQKMTKTSIYAKEQITERSN